ncbi:MAG: DUF2799 domain-containing protein [Gammaproteobacteria bacterium]|nr:DUF2799 domain-containing protein [Gammaproteobacteria bacterium]MDH3768171.1 DUF2799 domain-containing protein [Gammaproteobacteria bacterium]
MYYTSRRVFFVLCAIGLAGLTAGCATTMTQTQCVSADWYAIGLEDGARGQAMTRLTKHRQQCSEFGISPDVQAYQQGRLEGLDYFCTLSNGLSVGKTGSNYAGACPAEMEYYFLTGYRLGREMHRVRSDINTNRRDLRAAEKELQTEDVTDERTAELRYKLRTLEREFGRLQGRLEYLELEERRIVVSDARSANNVVTD